VDLTKLPTRSKDGAVHVVVEIPRGSHNKYEFDEELGVIKLDRTLYTAVYYPTDYGFIPGAEGGDGDPVDAMVMIETSTFPGCLVETRLIGVLTIKHDSGLPEEKLLGVPIREPRFEEFKDIADVPHHMLKEIEHFFDVFKELEGRDVGVLGWAGADEAEKVLERAIRRVAEKGND
jgi:inorganic pyrophosphatase